MYNLNPCSPTRVDKGEVYTMKEKTQQRQKNRWGIKTAHVFENLNFYEELENVGVMV